MGRKSRLQRAAVLFCLERSVRQQKIPPASPVSPDRQEGFPNFPGRFWLHQENNLAAETVTHQIHSVREILEGQFMRYRGRNVEAARSQ